MPHWNWKHLATLAASALGVATVLTPSIVAASSAAAHDGTKAIITIVGVVTVLVATVVGIRLHPPKDGDLVGAFEEGETVAKNAEKKDPPS